MRAPSADPRSAFCGRTTRATHGYRAILARLVNGLVSAGVNVLMTLDGARFPLKSAEHARRNKADTRAATIGDAEKADQAGDTVAANELYRKLYPAHDAVYDWLVAFCRSVSAPGKVKLYPSSL